MKLKRKMLRCTNYVLRSYVVPTMYDIYKNIYLTCQKRYIRHVKKYTKNIQKC